jgi:serine/threonine protein phosphatase 1
MHRTKPPAFGPLRPQRSFFARLFGTRQYDKPTVPAGTRVYAVGDIHGRLDLLDEILRLIAEDGKSPIDRKILVFLGDYVDRGPESKGVLARLLQPMPTSFEAHYLKGNHEQSLLGFLADPLLYRAWRHYGAMECLASYGVRPPLQDDDDAFIAARDALAQKMPPDHLNFLNNLELAFEIGDYFFAHAGVRPGISLDQQSPEDLLWIRESFLASDANFGKVVVHGHSPASKPSLRPNRIGVDTGAYATGLLTCAVLEGGACRFLQTQ